MGLSAQRIYQDFARRQAMLREQFGDGPVGRPFLPQLGDDILRSQNSRYRDQGRGEMRPRTQRIEKTF